MELIANNFTGTYKCGTRYRVVTDIEDGFFVVQLETFINGGWHYQFAEVEELNGNFEYERRKALKYFQERSGIQLIKSTLTQAA